MCERHDPLLRCPPQPPKNDISNIGPGVSARNRNCSQAAAWTRRSESLTAGRSTGHVSVCPSGSGRACCSNTRRNEKPQPSWPGYLEELGHLAHIAHSRRMPGCAKRKALAIGSPGQFVIFKPLIQSECCEGQPVTSAVMRGRLYSANGGPMHRSEIMADHRGPPNGFRSSYFFLVGSRPRSRR
jgi:hypothetical protein